MPTTDHNPIYVAIMAGGIGSRFWPVSRAQHPKQFLDIMGCGKTLIQQTVERFLKITSIDNIYIVTADEYVDITKAQLPQLPVDNIISEPERKNTAPCIAYISFKLAQLAPNASLIVAPADHLILEEDRFAEVCRLAVQHSEDKNALITLGIKPTYANTGYGYIQHAANEAGKSLFKVQNFTEKPDKVLAESFLASGDFLWNSGIFIWKVAAIMDAFEIHLPHIHELFQNIKMKLNTKDERSSIEEFFPKCPNISIDFGVMEKADNVYVIPSSFGWSDLGTWNSAWDNMEKDEKGNAVAGDNVILFDTTRCMVHKQNKKLLVMQGLDDYIVVDTNDALLICQKEKEQAIKEYVAEVKRQFELAFV